MNTHDNNNNNNSNNGNNFASYCIQCGNGLQINANFCSKCGTPKQTANYSNSNHQNNDKYQNGNQYQNNHQQNGTKPSSNNMRNRNFNQNATATTDLAVFSHHNLDSIDPNSLNIDMKLLVFGWCRKYEQKWKLSKNIPISLLLLVAALCDVILFTFDYRFSSLFEITPSNRKLCNVKKIDDGEHASIIFGNKLKINTFKWSNFNFVFTFRVINGIVNLMFVPSTFNHFTGHISKQDAINNNYHTLYLRNNFNYSYDEVVRVEIDMIKLCAYITNKSRNFSTTMDLNNIDKQNQIFCAFDTANPYAEFEIIDQHWQRKKKMVKSKYFNKNQDQYSDDEDDDISMDIKQSSDDITNIPNYKLSDIPPDRMGNGLNYIGKCSDHFAICNRGFAEDIRPEEDQEELAIICNSCNRPFKHELVLIHNCEYKIVYKLTGDNKKQYIKDTAFPDYVDVYGAILKNKHYSYLKLDISSNYW